MTVNGGHYIKMKYTGKIKRLIAMILVVATFVVNVFPQTVYAENIENKDFYEYVGINLTTLPSNTSQDWAIAFADGIAGKAVLDDSGVSFIPESDNQE